MQIISDGVGHAPGITTVSKFEVETYSAVSVPFETPPDTSLQDSGQLT